MRPRTFARCGLWLGLVSLLWSCLPASASPEPEPEPEPQPALRRLWAAQCAYCHDTGVAPQLRGRGLSALAVEQIVRRGGVQMPAFTPSTLSPAELVRLSRWVQALPAVEPRP